MRHTDWICIAWPKRGRRYVCKKLRTAEPITSAEAMRLFKEKLPKHRTYTAQPIKEQ